MTELTSHLERQVRSAQKLLRIVLAQTDAIKRQDVEALLARLGDVQLEMVERQRLEEERDRLLAEFGQRLGLRSDEVDLDGILTLSQPAEAQQARSLSRELRGLLAEIARVHGVNRVLIRQELSFLDHLLRVLSGTPEGGYSPGGWTAPPQAVNVVDARV